MQLKSLLEFNLIDPQIDPDKRPNVPFEVEKAMHNIMFIKHHMKRQDEFDAVSSHFDKKIAKFKF